MLVGTRQASLRVGHYGRISGNAHMSFEGRLNHLRLASIPGASEEETFVLKRNTIWPKQDFIVVPLEPVIFQDLSTT
jgi:hypothetical protein